LIICKRACGLGAQAANSSADGGAGEVKMNGKWLVTCCVAKDIVSRLGRCGLHLTKMKGLESEKRLSVAG
jgi:hypothetical protein